ncbi:MAG: DUF5305 family protein [Candidatus Bathycorpusculaceae bacterium]
MKKPPKTTILLTLFTILTLIALLTLYTAHQTPTEEITTNTICTYTSTATYDYTALLDPNNIIYNGKTTLKPGEGPIYTKITRQINITLTYTFEATLPTEATITYKTTQTLKTPAITYQINQTTPQTTNQKQIQIKLTPINKTELDPIIAKISSEMGITTTQYYTIEITPTFTINANTTASPIQQTFTPTLTITFQRTDQGEITTIEPLTQTKTGKITQNQTITREDIILQRNASYILATISIAGLAFSTYYHIKTKPKTKQPTPLEKLIAPYKDLIIEAKEPLKTPPETTIINVETIKELAKTAEILAKPIILTRTPKPTLTIIDQNTIYQHKPS